MDLVGSAKSRPAKFRDMALCQPKPFSTSFIGWRSGVPLLEIPRRPKRPEYKEGSGGEGQIRFGRKGDICITMV